MIRKAAITFFGLGYLHPAPGTWGSLGAIVMAGGGYWAMRAAGIGAWFDAGLIVFLLIASALSIMWGPWAIDYYARFARKPGDPAHFVLDEAAGQWVAILLLPLGAVASLQHYLLVFGMQFVLFRVFDITKPPPIRRFEKLPAGWGVLTDDLAAGVYANLIGQIVVRLWLVG
ncbi:MAG: phosphatidylglycerophosphatase A [Phycisphaerae bacterium]|nr:phosphatidylglycerophosphatase A [Phycisphaerae bacterium]